MGSVGKGIGRTLKNVVAGGLSMISGGAVDVNKMRINMPLSSGAMRSFAANHAKALSLGLADKQIDKLMNTKEAKLAGTAMGAAVGAGIGAGAVGGFGAGVAGAKAGALGGAAKGAIAAGATKGAVAGGTASGGLAPGVLTGASAGAGASAAGGSAVPTSVIAGGSALAGAGGATALAKLSGEKKDDVEIPKPPDPEEVARQLEKKRAEAEIKARDARSLANFKARKKSGPGTGDEDQSIFRSVLRRF